VLVVQAAAVAVHEPPRRIGDELAERRDSISERHGAWHPQGVPGTAFKRYAKNMKSAVCTGPVPSFNAISKRRQVPAQAGSVCQP